MRDKRDYYQMMLDTPLGQMVAIGDEQALYLLEFAQRPGLEREIERLRQKTTVAIAAGCTNPMRLLKNELQLYFEGKIAQFKTPICFSGTPFQKQVWEELRKIPFGETRSYSAIAACIGRPSAFRAVAQAIGANQLAIIVPCHRVINANGALGGYAGGLARKKSLLDLENFKI